MEPVEIKNDIFVAAMWEPMIFSFFRYFLTTFFLYPQTYRLKNK
jgi:hypothetical protein